MPEPLSRQALNRATLARQHLLGRADGDALGEVAHLIALQAQAPLAPYVGLWTRLTGFALSDLAGLMERREAVRTANLRTTVHLTTADDARVLRPLTQPVLERMFASTAWGQGLRGTDLTPILAAARELLEAAPRTRAELAALLARSFPDHDPAALGQAATYHLPLVQVTPRGVWGEGGAARWTTVAAWTGRDVEPDPSIGDVVLRYLAAFGPASTMDVQAWCGLTRLGAVLDGLRDQLVTFVDESGRELFDLPDAPRPDPDVEAPFRYLPEYDNVLLSHRDRSRFVEKTAAFAPAWAGNGGREGTILVDGRFEGFWSIEREQGHATLVIDPIEAMPKQHREQGEDEGLRLLAFVAADVPDRDVRVNAPR